MRSTPKILSTTALCLAAGLQCLFVCLCGWQGMYGDIVEPLAWALPLALLLGLCLRGARPRFGARCTALLYLPVIILFLGAVLPYYACR